MPGCLTSGITHLIAHHMIAEGKHSTLLFLCSYTYPDVEDEILLGVSPSSILCMRAVVATLAVQKGLD